MKLFVSELSYLSELYTCLKGECLDLDADDAGNAKTSLSDVILKNRDLISRIEKMNQRLSQLAKEWERLHIHFCPEAREEIRTMAAALSNTARFLIDQCQRRSRQLETDLGRLGHEMEALQKGNRYLQTIKPLKCNYPKFVDSRT